MSKMDFMKIMGEIDDEVLERFYAVEHKIGIMAVRRRVIRAISALVACLTVIASLAVVPALISGADEGEPDEVTTTTTKETTKRTTTKKPNSVISEPNPLYSKLRKPYAIVKILEVTDEKKNLMQNSQMFICPYVKIICEVLYTFQVNAPLAYPELEAENFETVTELYVIEDSVEEIAQYDTIMIYVETMNMNGKCYYGPLIDNTEKAEFIPFVDGKTVIDFSFNTSRSFGNFIEINFQIEYYAGKTSITSEAIKALPKEKFVSGMTYDQVVAFLDACNKVLEIHDNPRYRE